MRPRALWLKMLALVVGLLLVAQLATSLAVLRATRRQAEASAMTALRAGARVFDRLLADRERRLLASVEILASDFAFKRAVATADVGTIESVLENHGDRVRADATLLLSLSGDVLAEFAPDGELASADAEAVQRFALADRRSGFAELVVRGGAAYQAVFVPIRAPLPIAWVCMGFRLDDALAREFETITALEVSFGGRGGAEPLQAPASTLPLAAREALWRALATDSLGLPPREPGLLAGSDWLTLSIPLARTPAAHLDAVLQTSRTAALAPYRELRSELIALFAGGVLLAGLGAVATARGITRPLHQLAQAAEHAASGDYAAPIAVRTDDEIGVLAASFRTMQRAIAEREAEIVEQASRDPLTGLPNRTVAARLLSELVAGSGRVVVAMVDLDRLKDTNAAFGHAQGDAVLRAVAERLATGLEPGELLARVGGDEFLIALRPHGGAELARAEALLHALESPLRAGGALLRLAATAGIACFPADGADAETLLGRAELALTRAKADGARLARYAPGTEEANQRRIAILAALERAIAGDRLSLHYQPKVWARTQRVAGVEALVRWTDPELGVMRPDEFIALAERAGSVRALTQWVLRAATQQGRAWADRGLELPIAVNLSALDLADESLPALIEGSLRESALSPASFSVEITESAAMANPEQSVALLARVRALGVRVAVDDFGVGQSSLAQLTRLPADELKIDKSFVRRLRPGSAEEIVVRSAIELSHKLGLKVVAEGVEDGVVWRLLERLGCDAVQGYGICRPLPASELPDWLDGFEKGRARDDEDEA